MFASRCARLISSNRSKVARLAAEQLHRGHAGDVLLQEGVDPRDPGRARCGTTRARCARNHCVTSDDQRQHRERDQRQPPVHRDQHDHDADQREDVAEDRDDAGGEQLVQHVDVGRHARHQPADRIAVVELQVEPLQVPVDLHPHVEHDPLPGHLQRPGLDELERERRRAGSRGTASAIRSRPAQVAGRRCSGRSRASSGTAAPAAAPSAAMIAASASATCAPVRAAGSRSSRRIRRAS